MRIGLDTLKSKGFPDICPFCNNTNWTLFLVYPNKIDINSQYDIQCTKCDVFYRKFYGDPIIVISGIPDIEILAKLT